MRAFPMLVVALMLLGLSVVGCNKSPVITLLEGPSSVEKGTSATFTCHADDPDGNSLSYAWNCSSGQMTSPTGASITWTAPNGTGNATIQVIAEDPHGASDSTSKVVSVTAPYTQKIVDGTIDVPPGGDSSFEVSVTSSMFNANLVGDFFVYGNTDKMYVYVMDEANYVKWNGGHQFTPMYSSGYAWTGSFSVWFSMPGAYYLVYDNRAASSSHGVTTTVDLKYQE
jgi:hypothetical protein